MKKRSIFWIATVIAWIMLHTTVWASSEPERDLDYADNEFTYNIESGEVDISSPGNYYIYGNGQVSHNQIRINAEGVVELTLRNVYIDLSAEDSGVVTWGEEIKDYGGIPICIQKGEVHLNIEGVNTLLAGNLAAGIFNGKNPLVIDGTGTLKVTSGRNAAAIGGNYTGPCENLTINGGTIEAIASEHGTAIGAGWEGYCKNLSITGGTIYAKANIGETYGFFQCGDTAIGGKDCEGISISGGTVYAYGGQGPGIGGEYTAKNIMISGGTVHAYGGDLSAAIGCGGAVRNDGEKTICESSAENISIAGGNVYAYGACWGNKWQGAAIGGGRYADVKNISISGGTVYAEASEFAAAIGSGMAGICENISISGGVVNAKANSYGAAIGTGAYDAINDGIEKKPFADGIYISGGQLHIKAGAYASAGIGSGSGFSKNIFLSGGTIIVEASGTGIAIGNRENGYDVIDIKISGGNIHASTFSNCRLVNDKGAEIVEHQIVVGTDHTGKPVAQVNVPEYGTKDMYVDNEGAVHIYTDAANKNISVVVGGITYKSPGDASSGDGSQSSSNNGSGSSTQNSGNAVDNGTSNTGSLPAAGEKLTDIKTKTVYIVIAPGSAVAYAGTTDKKAVSLSIPATVKISGVTYKVTSVAKNALKNNKKLQKVTISGNVAHIGASAFQGCSALKTVKMGSKVTVIGDKAFSGCKKLSSLVIGNNVSEIGGSTFQNCVALKKITIPAKVKKIGASAFSGCKNLTGITVKSQKLTEKNVGSKTFAKAGSSNYKKMKVTVPAKKYAAYKKLLKKKGLSVKAKIVKK